MADIKIFENLYLEADYQGNEHKYIDSPLPIASTVSYHITQ